MCSSSFLIRSPSCFPAFFKQVERLLVPGLLFANLTFQNSPPPLTTMAAIFDSIVSPIRSLLGCPRASENEDEDEEYEPPQTVDINDHTAVRHVLDETVASYASDVMCLEEDLHSSNLKLGIMTFACIIAMFGQFFPLAKFSWGRYFVGFCCAMYFISSGILQLVYWYVDQNIIFTSLYDEDLRKQLRIRTNLHQHETNYDIIVEHLDLSGELVGKAKKKTVLIENYFTEHGEFYEAGLDVVMKELCSDFKNPEKNKNE